MIGVIIVLRELGLVLELGIVVVYRVRVSVSVQL